MVLTPAALACTVASSLAWAGFDACRKGLAERMPAEPLVVLLMLGQIPFFGLWLLAGGAWEIDLGYLLPATASVLLNVAANVMFLRSVSMSPLSVTVPLLALSPVFAAIAAIPVLGEVPDASRAAGVVLVVVGALWLNLPGSRLPWSAAAWRELLGQRGSMLMVGVAVLWACSSTADKAAVLHAPPALHAIVQCGGVAIILLAVLATRRELGALRGIRAAPALYAGALLVAVAALGLQLLAFRLTLVSFVEAIKRAIGMVTAVVVGRVAFGEHVTRRKLAAVAIMILGVLLVLL